MIGNFFNFLANSVFDFINGLLGIFPKTPDVMQNVEQLSGVQTVATVLKWVNWLLPLDIASAMIALWAVAMFSYLGVKMALKYTGEIV